VAQATGRATPARDERGQRGSETSARRPDARRKLSARETTGRATEAVGARDDRRRYGSCRRVRRPAALRKLSARETIAETSRRSETSGASCRTSQEPAVPRDCADRSESVIWGGARGTSARGGSQTSGDARYERREGVRGRPKAAGRLAQKLPSPALKGGGAFWILQSRRSEHPYGGNCTERHRARTIAGGAAYAVPCESTRT
jgi:hypothetical protein